MSWRAGHRRGVPGVGPGSRARSSCTAAALVLALAGCGSGGEAKPDPGDRTTTTSVAGACQNGGWPRLAQGEPKILAGAAVPSGYFLWNDFLGWHVRVVDVGPEQVFRGAVVASGATVSAKAVPDPSIGAITVSGNRLDFEIAGGPEPRGFDIAVGCASGLVRFELNGNEGPWPIDGVFLGGSGRAYANPLVIERQR